MGDIHAYIDITISSFVNSFDDDDDNDDDITEAKVRITFYRGEKREEQEEEEGKI